MLVRGAMRLVTIERFGTDTDKSRYTKTCFIKNGSHNFVTRSSERNSGQLLFDNSSRTIRNRAINFSSYTAPYRYFQPTLPPRSLSLLYSLFLSLVRAPVALLYRLSFSLLFMSLLCSLMHVQLPLYRLSVDPAASRSHAAVCSKRYAISGRNENEFRARLNSWLWSHYNISMVIREIVTFNLLIERDELIGHSKFPNDWI